MKFISPFKANFFQISYLLFFFIFISNIVDANSVTLNLAKKRNFNLGKGEKVSLELKLHKYNNFSYKSSTKGPFIFEKIGRGKIKITFQSGLLDVKDRIIGKTYKQSFRFTQKNIGQNFYVTFSATYEPGLYFKSNNKRSTDISITNGNIKEATVILIAKKDYTSRFDMLYNENLFMIDSLKKGIILNKGENPITIKFITNENFYEELTLYGDNIEGRTEKLYIRLKRNVKKSKLSVVKALKMDKPKVEEKKIDETPKDMELNRQSSSKPKKEEVKILPKEEGKSNLIEFISLVLNAVFLIIILILFVKNLAPKKDIDTDKHFMFYTNAATLLDVNLKGRSFDHTMDEMVIKLIELTDGGKVADKFEGKDFNKGGIDLQKKINERKNQNQRKKSNKKLPKKHVNVIQKNDDSFLIEDTEKKDTEDKGERIIQNSFSEEDEKKKKETKKKKSVSKFDSTIDFLSEDDGYNSKHNDNSSEELNISAEKTIEDRRKNLLKFMKKE